MRLKSFTAPTAAEAMAQLRAVLGEDAIIVATHEDQGGGIRVTAAVDDADTAIEERRTAHRRPAGVDAAETAVPSAEGVVDTVYHAFRRHGLPAAIGEPLLEEVAGYETTEPATALAATLRRAFRFEPTAGPAPAGRRRDVMMVVGPPGAGKTQTVAKQAARALMAGRQVRLVTTDTGRTGGAAVLAAFARGMKLPLAGAETPEALTAALAGFDDSDLVVIDSAGRNHLDSADLAGLGRYLIAGGVEPLLVVPAGLDPVEAADIALTYKDFGVRRLVATRIDMTRRLGSVLAAAYAAGLAFADFGTTARIKDGLTPASPEILAHLLLSPSRAAATRPRQSGNQR